mgnify:CR=1 FL=1
MPALAYLRSGWRLFLWAAGFLCLPWMVMAHGFTGETRQNTSGPSATGLVPNRGQWPEEVIAHADLPGLRLFVQSDGLRWVAYQNDGCHCPPPGFSRPGQCAIRFRTIGDATCTGAVESPASDLDEVIAEVAAARQTERGTRADDKRSETAMEDRKKEGYF